MNNLISELEATTKGLLGLISSFTQEQFNIVPFVGSWTAGQVAEHLYKSESGIPVVLLGATKETQRKPDEKLEIIKSIFLDFDTKFKSPEAVLPSEGIHKKDDLLNAFKANRDKITKLVKEVDLSRTCTSLPFPQLGELTRLEWIYFMIVHTKRHTRQLNNIFKILTNKKQ